MGPRSSSLLLLCLVLLGCSERAAETRPAPPILVAAASDLTVAFPKVGAAFERHGGGKVRFTFGSTGLFTKQIESGAPFDVFAAAQASFVDAVTQKGDCDVNTRAPYGRGRVVVWSRPATGTPPRSLAELAGARFQRLAIAQPEHAPYGRAAQQALVHEGLWQTLAPRIVYGENVKQAMQFAESGNAEAAFVALALVIDRPASEYMLVDAALHAPIEQVLVACKHGKNPRGGAAFARFVNGPEGRAILRSHGFVLPSESMAEAP